MIRLDQQQAVGRTLAGGLGHRCIQQAKEGGTIEEAGALVALLEFLDLARQRRIRVLCLAAKDHLLAGLAFVLRCGELHHRREIVAFDVARGQFIARRRCLAFGQALEQGLEFGHVRRCDQVEQGHPFDVLERLIAEHLQIGRVGADMHAFVDIGDGFARGIDQRIAAALGFAHLRLHLPLRAAGMQVAPSIVYHAQQLLRPAAQGHALRAEGLHATQDFVGHPVEHCQQRHIAPAAANHQRHLVERQVL